MADIRTLQTTIGNRAVGRLIQAKLTVGHADDRYEREADLIAEHVMRAVSARPATTDADAAPAGDGDLRIARVSHAHDPLGGMTVDPAAESAISRPGGGSPLPGDLRPAWSPPLATTSAACASTRDRRQTS
ncbi:MAG: hypothetical protein ACRD2W_07490 [Acidimicrobiales bacterium]